MIFVATGTQYPFDRLLQAIEKQSWPANEKIIAQTGNDSLFESERIECITSMGGDTFDQYIQQSRLIIAHAGMGTILSAIAHSKPVICVPRLYKFKEHINDHQSDTLEKLEHPLLIKCFELEDLASAIKQAEELDSDNFSLPENALSQAVLEMLE
jgi:UDP-N-acetylglucosamine transferase subunit ALG13